MKKGDVYEGRVLKTEFPNKGILYLEEIDGKERKTDETTIVKITELAAKVLKIRESEEENPDHFEKKATKIIVKNALEGQKIQYSISKKRKGKVEGRLLKVLEKSPLENITSPCIHFGSCGGCCYQNLSYENQLALKKSQVEELFAKANMDIRIEDIYGSPICMGYRNKMEFTFGDEEKEGPLALGMHKKNSFYDIVSLKNCQIVDPDFNVILQAVLSYFTLEQAAHYHRMRHEGFLRHLVMRRSVKTGDILINLVTTTQGTLKEEEFVNVVISLEKQGKIDGSITGILHTVNDSLADVVQSDATKILYGQDYFYEYLLNMKFKISPFSFFQTNTLGAEVLYEKVREYVGETKDKLIYDLYTGTGTIAQMLAPVAKKVVGVEIVEEAVEAAKINAVGNHLANCEFIAGDVLKVVDNLTEKPDIIVLDPPRDGIHPKALKKILDFGVEEMVYVSCKPTSLVRDLEMCQEAGYEVKRCCLVDLFPGTVHVETCVLLVRECAHDDEMVSIKVDLEGISLDQGKFEADEKPTYGNIKKWIKEKYGINVTNLYIGQIKDKVGMEKRKNYNTGSGEGRVPTCPADKGKAIMEAFKHFGLV